MQEMYGTFEHTGSLPDVPQVAEALMPFLTCLKVMLYNYVSGFIM